MMYHTVLFVSSFSQLFCNFEEEFLEVFCFVLFIFSIIFVRYVVITTN